MAQTAEINLFMVLEATLPRSGCQYGWFLLGLQGEPVPGLSPAFWGFPGIWRHTDLCLCLQEAFSLCVCLCSVSVAQGHQSCWPTCSSMTSS